MPVKSLLKKEVLEMINDLSGEELYANNLYTHLATQLQRLGFFGSQKYFESESESERKHYYKLRDFVNNMGASLDMPAVEACKDKVGSIGDALQIYYDAEHDLLEKYRDVYEKMEKLDCVTAQFLLQFLQIQQESVGEAGDLIARYAHAEANKEILEFDEHIYEPL